MLIYRDSKRVDNLHNPAETFLTLDRYISSVAYKKKQSLLCIVTDRAVNFNTAILTLLVETL